MVLVSRKQIRWPIALKDDKLAMQYECPMTLSPMYNPVSIAGSNPQVSLSQPSMDMLTRRYFLNSAKYFCVY